MFALLVAATSLEEPAKPKISDLAFMTGGWICPQETGTFEEHWLAPLDAMQGYGRHVVDGKTRFMEFMSIEADDEGLVMWIILGAPSKGEKKPFPFRLKSFDGKTAIFENPKNDFPTRIIYRNDGKSTLTCWLEGTQKGHPARQDYPFKRIKL